ncbi:DUF5694 domain-containing protein [Robiginitalea sp. IMCC44478]|uniref:DUF5694 domain-containing protein n=1 Tax=Robiginitalea sp. IMCC44478 TaxID=3459122 RepID=UPI00404162A3
MESVYRITLLLLLFLSSYYTCAQETDPDPSAQIKIALLGVFHFGETSDLAAIKADSLLGQKRQAEILQLIQKLRAYNPTKILLEYPAGRDDTINARYERFLNGNFTLPENEIYQLGFRLASLQGHGKVYGIDYRMELPFEPLMQYCRESGKEQELNDFIGSIRAYTEQESRLLQGMTLSDYFLRMNSDKADIAATEIYLRDLLAFGNEEQPLGINFSAAWYKRNLTILKNIADLTNAGDRVLVIIGAAHRAVLKDYIKGRSDLDYAEISAFLADD